MSFSVVIVTYNRLNLLKECIKCVENQSFYAENIVIINNCSTDGTKEYLDSIKKDNIIIYHSSQNLGGAGGFSLGVQEASKLKSKWVVLIDDDAMLDADFLKNISANSEKNSDILSYSGTVMVDGKIDIAHRVRIRNSILYLDYPIPEKEYEEETFFCDTASFCGLVISKELIKKIGMPEKEFFIWFDDTEYSLRIRKYTKILNVNSAIINHKSIFLGNNGFNWKDYYGRRNRLLMIKKHFSKSTFIFNFFKVWVKCISKSIKYLIDRNEKNLYIKNLCYDSLKDAMNNKAGKNEKYLPTSN